MYYSAALVNARDGDAQVRGRWASWEQFRRHERGKQNQSKQVVSFQVSPDVYRKGTVRANSEVPTLS